MSENIGSSKPLNSWKEIAAYLGCNERTCCRWEKKFGLPIHRLGGAEERSHVFAYREELDQWLRSRREKERNGGLRPEAKASAFLLTTRHPVFKAALIVLAAAVFMGGICVVTGMIRASNAAPADFRIDGANLVILDEKGRELGRYDTGEGELIDESEYRLHFQNKSLEAEGIRLSPFILFRDINGDGRKEILFAVRTETEFHKGAVLCLDRRGRLLWSFDVNREATFGGERFAAVYGIQGIDVFPCDSEAGSRILVIAYQRPEFPTYAAVLSADGRLVGEYWNSGRFFDYQVIDLNGDGKKELVLAGTNNEYLKGCLAVVDPETVRGASPQTGKYLASGLPANAEKYYLLFPRTAVDLLEDARESIAVLDLFGSDRLVAMARRSKLFYRLNFRMEPEAVIISDAFFANYRKHQGAGNIPPGDPEPARIEKDAASGILYWDGERWVSTPTWNLKYR